MFIENEFSDEILKLLLNYITLRVDIINISKDENEIEIVENSDQNSRVSFPKWFKRDKSQGAVIASSNLSLDLKVKCTTEGTLRVILKSIDMKDKNKERFPIYIDINEFMINKEFILKKHRTISFSQPAFFSKSVKKDEIVNIHLKWMPFNRQCEYKNPVIPLENKINKLNSELEFYKSNKNSSMDLVEFKKINDELDDLKMEFNDYKKTSEKYFDSFHFLLDDLYINHEQKPIGFSSQLQEVNVEVLSFIDNICKKHGLEWWLDYGNLIGAIRHGGSVPWDDDVDIGMMRTDYMKLCDIVSDEIKANNLENIVDIYFRQRKIDYNRASSFLQIKFYSEISDIADSRMLLANVDVFPYDYITSFNTKLDDLYYNTKMNYFNNLIDNQKSEEECFKIMYDELNLTFDKTDFIIPGIEGACGPKNTYPLSVFKTEKIFPLSNIKYSDRIFPCPNDTHYYLKRIYGDYLSFPKKLHVHRRVQRFRYVKNKHIIYSNLLQILKDINSSF